MKKTGLWLALFLALSFAIPGWVYCTEGGHGKCRPMRKTTIRPSKEKVIRKYKKPEGIRKMLERRKENTKIATYKNSKWRVVLDKNGNLICYGAGHGTWGVNDGITLASGVGDFWTAGSWRGPVIVFRQGNNYYTQLLRYDKGNTVASSQIYPKGEVNNVRVDGRIYGAHIYFNFSNGSQTTYSIWQHPNLPGKVEKGIRN